MLKVPLIIPPYVCARMYSCVCRLLVESCAQLAAQTKTSLNQLLKLVLFLAAKKQVVWLLMDIVLSTKEGCELGDQGFTLL